VANISDFTQPQTGLLDFVFGGSIIAILGAAIWSVTKYFSPKTPGKQAK